MSAKSQTCVFLWPWYPESQEDPTSANNRPPELSRGARRSIQEGWWSPHVNSTGSHTLVGFSVLDPKVPQDNHLPAALEPITFRVEFNHWTSNTWLNLRFCIFFTFRNILLIGKMLAESRFICHFAILQSYRSKPICYWRGGHALVFFFLSSKQSATFQPFYADIKKASWSRLFVFHFLSTLIFFFLMFAGC